jgi:DNA-binding CsgD family transcriptional regulator
VHLQRMRLWLSLWRGELNTAVEFMRSWRPGMLVQAEIEMQSRLGFARIEAEIALARNDLEQARNAVSVLLAPVHRGMSGYDLPLAVVAARVLARMRWAGRYSASELTATETALRALVEQSESWPTASVWIPLFDAELAGEDGRGTDLESWERAVSAVSQPIAPAHLRPYALFRLAQAGLEAGDRSAAENALRTAHAGADALGAGLIVGWIDALAARAGLSLGGAKDVVAGSASDGREVHSVRLTDREQQVLALIGQGLSNKQIGVQLFISAKTASVHVSAILRKLGATTRTEAVYLAQHAGHNVGGGIVRRVVGWEDERSPGIR